ncbi:MAG: aromatic ring-hydroxylating dioxygenase subunit alpha [Pseudomonadota bacterium]
MNASHVKVAKWSDTGLALPPSAYLDETVFNKEIQTLFLKGWLCVGRVADYAEPGSYFTLNIANQPILIWCGEDSQIRAFENVCRHRMSLLAEGQGTSRGLSCPYHGWHYQSNGQLRAAPKLTPAQAQEICLPEFKVETWLGFVFVNCDPAAEPLAPQLQAVEDMLQPYAIEQFKYSQISDGGMVAANWKLVVEIGLESYHFPFVHKQTLAANLLGAPNPPAGNGYWTVSVEPRSEPLAPQASDPEALTESHRETTYTYGLFPSTVFNIDVDNLVWFTVLPISPEKSKVIFGSAARSESAIRILGANEASSAEEYLAWGANLGAEDNAASERVQQGLKGMHAKPGPLIRSAENCLFEMQQYLEAHLPGYPLFDEQL